MAKIKKQINNLYSYKEKLGYELLNNPNDINEILYRSYKERLEKTERIFINALGKVNPSLAIELEEAYFNNDLKLLRKIDNRIEKEIFPNGNELYKVDGKEFLKITQVKEFGSNKMTIINKYELIE